MEEPIQPYIDRYVLLLFHGRVICTILIYWGWALVNQFNNTNGMTDVTPTDRPKSVRNRCVIKVFGGVFYVVTLPFWIFVWV